MAVGLSGRKAQSDWLEGELCSTSQVVVLLFDSEAGVTTLLALWSSPSLWAVQSSEITMVFDF